MGLSTSKQITKRLSRRTSKTAPTAESSTSLTKPVQDARKIINPGSKNSLVPPEDEGKVKLDDIEVELDSIRKEIVQASGDQRKLSFFSQKLKDLKEKLSKINVKQASDERRKGLLEKKTLGLMERVSDFRRQLAEGANTDDNKTTDDLKFLNHIEKEIVTLGENINRNNYLADKNEFATLKSQLESIEDSNDEMSLKKSAVFNLLQNFESILKAIEAEVKLERAEEQFRRFLEGLTSLKNDVAAIEEISQIILERKNTFLNQINFILERGNENSGEVSNHCQLETNGPHELLSEIEENLEKARPKVSAFVGLESSEEYFELDEALMTLILKLDSLKFDQNSESHLKKIYLLKTINSLHDALDETVEQLEKIYEIKRQITEINNKIDSNIEFSMIKGDFAKVKAQFNMFGDVKQSLNAEKEECFKKLNTCEKKLITLSNNMVL